MSQEFTEERENELGDLPDSLLKERGEAATDNIEPEIIPPGSLATGRAGSGIPLDIEREARIQDLAAEGEIGSPPRDLSVTSIYDARPMNARDFLHTATDKINLSNGDPVSLVAEATYTVPQGYVGVWRGFSFTPSNPVAFVSQGDATLDAAFYDSVLTSLFTNNIVVPDYENMQLGQNVNFQLPTFVIGNEGVIFKIRVTVTQDYLDAVAESLFRFTFYGQNLITRGLPTRFEIASQHETGPIGA